MGWTQAQYEANLAKQQMAKVPVEAARPQTKGFTVTFKGDPIGKPRMTQRDVWKKRPCVVRYREFADRLRATAGEVPQMPDELHITARIAMPESWNAKKKTAMDGKPHRNKPDWDNIGKAVSDVLLKEDSVVWNASVKKYWCYDGHQGLDINIGYCNL